MRVVVSTGAGISIASGLKAFRGPGGLWTENPDLEAKSNKSYIAKNLDEFWQIWGTFRQEAKAIHPNFAHYEIARAQEYLRLKSIQQDSDHQLRVITQNVDDLHTRAGNLGVVELHGNIFRSRCVNASSKGCRESWIDYSPTDQLCSWCGGPSRPDIIAFGEDLPTHNWNAAVDLCLNKPDLFIAVGTSGMVMPAADLVSIAKANGAKTMLLNLENWEHPHPDFDETRLGDCTTLLEQVFKEEIYDRI